MYIQYRSYHVCREAALLRRRREILNTIFAWLRARLVKLPEFEPATDGRVFVHLWPAPAAAEIWLRERLLLKVEGAELAQLAEWGADFLGSFEGEAPPEYATDETLRLALVFNPFVAREVAHGG